MESCAPIAEGSVAERNVTFEFPVPLGGPYAADVIVSEDGARMAGAFHAVSGWGSPTAWVRIDPGETWLPEIESAVLDVVSARVGRYSIALNGGTAIAGFSPGNTYSFALLDSTRRALLYGDLGPFWEGELSWNEAEQTLRAGPVPETQPDLATELVLHFEDTVLREIAATFPSGETATFTATQE
jgi:hypothetical protein